MPNLSDRVAELPPAKRQLLEKLVRATRVTEAIPDGAGPAGPPASSADRVGNVANVRSTSRQEVSAQASLSLTFGSSLGEIKQGYQRFYNSVSAQLDATVFGEFAFFLNYGYVVNLNPQFSQVELPDRFINKNSVRLVLEVIGDCPINGRRVLDIGCGRGGTVYVIHSFFDPAEITGLDLSAVAINFCRKAHQYPRVQFEQGDAEQLTFLDHSFDVITNVESSHSYPNINAFYAEVYRVLTPGGHFLYTDVLSVDDWKDRMRSLEKRGFTVERERDITSNVLLSCDEVALSRVQAFDSGNDPQLMQNFLATPGSEAYVEMSRRRWKYSLLKLRKPS